MDLRIGTTLDQRSAVFDTRSPRLLVLVGDPGHGKTTSARFLARWWLAPPFRHVHLYAACLSEWADLRHEPNDLTGRVGAECDAGTCMVVVDDVDHAPCAALALLPIGSAPVVVTSRGGGLEALELLEDGYTCLALVRRCDPGFDRVADGQGRLGWPVETIPVVAEQRGPADFAAQRCHLHPDEKAGRRRAGSAGSPAVVAGVAR